MKPLTIEEAKRRYDALAGSVSAYGTAEYVAALEAQKFWRDQIIRLTREKLAEELQGFDLGGIAQ